MAAHAAPADASASDRAFRTLASVAEELRAAFVRIVAYGCGLMMLALIAADVMSRLYIEADMAPQPVIRAVAWRPVDRPQPAFAASASAGKSDLPAKTASYEILRHPEGGRRDILRWASEGAVVPPAAVEVYRPGGELMGFAPATLVIADRVAGWQASDLQAAGMIETKFGPAALVSFQVPGEGAPKSCTGFVLDQSDPLVEISGWTCRSDSPRTSDAARGRSLAPPLSSNWRAQRQSAGCLLDRLTLLAAGSDPKLAEFFARAELKRGADCGIESVSVGSDWISAPERPQLRGMRQ